LYGLQRSGTNFLESLVNLNYPSCRFLNGELRSDITHKHFRLYNRKECIPEPQFMNSLTFDSFAAFEKMLPQSPHLYVVVSKDPYSWYVSYNKWSQKNNWPPHDYNYIEEYNLFYGKWMEFSKQTGKVIFIRYADLLQQPISEINRIGQALDLPHLQQLRQTNKVYASRKFTGNRKEEFLSHDHLKKIPPGEMSTLNQLLDKELMKFLGYDIL